MHVKPLGLSTRAKFVSHDWLFLYPPGNSKSGSDLE